MFHNLLRASRLAKTPARCDRVNCAQLMGVITQNTRHSIDSNTGTVDEEQLKKAKQYGKWIWSHDAEQYAQQNYGKALIHLNNGTEFQNTNIPPGYTCKPWTIADFLDRPDGGVKFTLEGDWS